MFSEISTTAFLEMSIYFERKFFSDPKLSGKVLFTNFDYSEQ